jgi:hypothetical protein
MHGYAAARALFSAMAAAAAAGQAPEGPALRDALAGVDILTPLGRVQFDSRGEPRFYPRVVVQIQQGRHVVVYPPEAATASLVYRRP